MNFKGWKIKVEFEKANHPTPMDEKQERAAMESTLDYLINEIGFMPRQDDLIADIEGDLEPFLVEQIIFEPRVQVITIVLSEDDEHD